MSVSPPLKIQVKTEELYLKDSKLKPEDVFLILQWVENQPHLPQISEFQAILFLQSCYYSIEATQTCIENYFTSRTQNRFIFECPSVEIIKNTFEITIIAVLPERTPDGRIILYYQLTDSDVKKFISLDHIRVLDMVVALNIYQYGPATGIDMIIDTTKGRIMHVTKIHLNGMRKMMYHIQEAIPLRINGFHFYCMNYATEKFLGLIKPLMKKELADKLISHKNNLESLMQYVPIEFIAEEWGGTYGSLAKIKETSLRNLLDNMEFFKWQDTQLVDESKRVKKSRGFFNYFWSNS